MKKHILIVEDEPSIAEVLVAYCVKEGYRVDHLSDGVHVLDYVKKHPLDLILLDLMLPSVDGMSLCREIRTFSQVAIIMVTAKHEEIDRLLGLELGADDYVCKPFSPKEVVARIKSVLRRSIDRHDYVKHVSEFLLDPEKYKTLIKGKPVELTAIEFKILYLLQNNPRRTFTRESILNSVYSDTMMASERSIDTHIKNIRKKIKMIDKDLNPIQAIYGEGYAFKP